MGSIPQRTSGLDWFLPRWGRHRGLKHDRRYQSQSQSRAVKTSTWLSMGTLYLSTWREQRTQQTQRIQTKRLSLGCTRLLQGLGVSRLWNEKRWRMVLPPRLFHRSDLAMRMNENRATRKEKTRKGDNATKGLIMFAYFKLSKRFSRTFSFPFPINHLVYV